MVVVLLLEYPSNINYILRLNFEDVCRKQLLCIRPIFHDRLTNRVNVRPVIFK